MKKAIKIEFEFDDGSSQILTGDDAEEFMKIERNAGLHFIPNGYQYPKLPWIYGSKDYKEYLVVFNDNFTDGDHISFNRQLRLDVRWIVPGILPEEERSKYLYDKESDHTVIRIDTNKTEEIIKKILAIQTVKRIVEF